MQLLQEPVRALAWLGKRMCTTWKRFEEDSPAEPDMPQMPSPDPREGLRRRGAFDEMEQGGLGMDRAALRRERMSSLRPSHREPMDDDAERGRGSTGSAERQRRRDVATRGGAPDSSRACLSLPIKSTKEGERSRANEAGGDGFDVEEYRAFYLSNAWASAYSQEDLEFVNSQLDHALMERWGYTVHDRLPASARDTPQLHERQLRRRRRRRVRSL